jgi:antitoxin (DNA-binding transcriptional repressor) of toxin-antitoxin stability system
MKLLRNIGRAFAVGQDSPGSPGSSDRRGSSDSRDSLASRDSSAGRDRRGSRDRLAFYNTYDARLYFSQLLERVVRGEQIVIARSGVPIAKLVPYGGEAVVPGLVRTHVYFLPRQRRLSRR